jgi:hypothetical protein
MSATISEQAIADDIVARVTARGAGKSICPSETARGLAGASTEAWGPLMGPIRKVAVRLAGEGKIVILRKGRVVDPAHFKGVYRLALASPDASARIDEV